MIPRIAVIFFALSSHFALHWNVGIRAEKVPEVSSTLLRMHRLYMQQPPHDTTLYDVLQVSPNATAAQIKKSYRKLSRIYHPDKQRRNNNDSDDQEDRAETEQQYERMREAYEVLKEDQTRLPYHRYGLVDTVHAVYLLTGRFQDAVDRDPNLTELLHLMGYSLEECPSPPLTYAQDISDRASVGEKVRRKQEHNQRVKFIATNILGTIRPLVEGSVDEAFLADLIVTQCDRLKKLPMGAQIIRCIGRAYRYSGRRLLRRFHANPRSFGIDKKHGFFKSSLVSGPALMGISDGLRDHLRRAEHVIQVAVASGKVIISETKHNKQEARKTRETKEKHHDLYYGDDETGEIPVDFFESLQDNENESHLDFDSLAGFLPPEEDEMSRSEQRRAQKAIIESLRIEALWKICKIDLDRTVREGCNLVLEGSMLLYQQEGWVGSSGIAISSNVARIRAAAALIMIGEIMVQRSKEGTAWME